MLVSATRSSQPWPLARESSTSTTWQNSTPLTPPLTRLTPQEESVSSSLPLYLPPFLFLSFYPSLSLLPSSPHSLPLPSFPPSPSLSSSQFKLPSPHPFKKTFFFSSWPIAQPRSQEEGAHAPRLHPGLHGGLPHLARLHHSPRQEATPLLRGARQPH